MTELLSTGADDHGRRVPLHDKAAFEGMHKAGRIAAETLDYIADFVAPGVSTEHLDDLMYQFFTDKGAASATIGYRGYEKASCISINHVVCHGIPTPDRKLVKGDILNIDVTVIVDGWYGDTSRMYVAGKPSVLTRRLMDTTYECLMRSIDVVKPGATLGDIGHTIQQIAEEQRFSVVRDFCGHGLGRVFHDAPNVMHFGRPGEGLVLEEGMLFTIEPMINAGKYPVKVLSDGWTAVTRDRKPSAQYEHSIGVTSDGADIFTLSPKGLHCPHNGL